MNGRQQFEQALLEQDSERGDMAELKKVVIESMRTTLVDNVDPTKFLPFLRSKFVVSDRENAEIKSCCARSVYEGADKLVDVLCTKGARGYDFLAEAIHSDQTQLYLLKEMNMRLEKLKYIKQQEAQTLRARLQDQQRNMAYHQQHDHTAAYMTPQHPGGPVMSSPSTSAYAHPPTQFIAMQHYNRGGVSYDHTYYQENTGLTGRGGATTGPVPNPGHHTPNSAHSVGALPTPPGCEDQDENMPGGQQQ